MEPSTVRGREKTTVNKISKYPCSHGTDIVTGGDEMGK